mgnify:CR=1 FL=1
MKKHTFATLILTSLVIFTPYTFGYETSDPQATKQLVCSQGKQLAEGYAEARKNGYTLDYINNLIDASNEKQAAKGWAKLIAKNVYSQSGSLGKR